MPILMAIVAALGGLAFWRRKKLGEDAKRLSGAARHTVDGMRSGRKDLLIELGERSYTKSTGDEDPDNEAEIARLIGELEAIDASSNEMETDEEPSSEFDTSAQ